MKQKIALVIAALLTTTVGMAQHKKTAAKQQYPMTQTYDHNPLFVKFPSPTWQSATEGPLYTADPTARVWNIGGKEVLFLYPSHDMEPAIGCDRMDRYHVFSTEDMKTWTDYGEIINAEQVNRQYAKEFPYIWGNDPVEFMWAPDCVYNPKDKLYYYFFPHTVAWRGKNGAPETQWKIFVATSKSPSKGFKVKGYVKGALSYIDPCIFIDDDGTAYFYQGGGAHFYAGKLKKDNYLEVDGEMIPQTGVEDFHEGAWVFKRNGKYYLSYPDNHAPQLGGNRMQYAIADSPLGPWKSMGVYLYAHGEETTHGSVVQFKGKWYQFYHTGNFSGRGNVRSVCVDELTFNADGTINPIRNWGTPKGGSLPELKDRLIIEAENYNDGGSHYGFFKRPLQWDVFEAGKSYEQPIEVKAEGQQTFLSHMTRNEWTRYSLNVKQEGLFNITVRMRQNGTSDSRFTLCVDGNRIRRGETPVGAASNEWGNTEFIDVPLPAGEHYIEWRSLHGDIDVDYIRIEKAQ